MNYTVRRKKDRRLERAKTEAVQRGEKIQFNGFYLTHGHYSSGATFHDAKLAKLLRIHCTLTRGGGDYGSP